MTCLSQYIHFKLYYFKYSKRLVTRITTPESTTNLPLHKLTSDMWPCKGVYSASKIKFSQRNDQFMSIHYWKYWRSWIWFFFHWWSFIRILWQTLTLMTRISRMGSLSAELHVVLDGIRCWVVLMAQLVISCRSLWFHCMVTRASSWPGHISLLLNVTTTALFRVTTQNV